MPILFKCHFSNASHRPLSDFQCYLAMTPQLKTINPMWWYQLKYNLSWYWKRTFYEWWSQSLAVTIPRFNGLCLYANFMSVAKRMVKIREWLRPQAVSTLLAIGFFEKSHKSWCCHTAKRMASLKKNLQILQCSLGMNNLFPFIFLLFVARLELNLYI